MKFPLSHLQILLTALFLAAGGLFASAGSAGADELVGPGIYAVHDDFVSEKLVDVCSEVPVVSDSGCAAGHDGACCSNGGSGCCAPCGVCGRRAMVRLIDLTLNHSPAPPVVAMSGIEPQAYRRPPKLLA